MPPLYFQPAEFFDYVLSDKWTGATSLRVVGGELLALLLAAITDLEVYRKINPHELRANLNSRRLCQSRDDEAPEMVYEKLDVELIYYEKAEMSNLPLEIVEQRDPLASPKTQVLPREVVHLPYVYTKHKVNKYQQLCPEENIQPKDVIAKLEEELNVAKEKRALAIASALANEKLMLSKDSKKTALAKSVEPTKDLKSNQDSSGPPGTYNETIDYIADDPNLVRTEFKKPKSKLKLDTKSTSVLEPMSTQPSKPLTPIASFSAMEGASLEELQRDDSEHSLESYSASIEGIQQEDSESNWEMLNLTRRELYVSGLYEGRESNFVSCEEKLKARGRIRKKIQMEKEKEIFEDMLAKAKTDLTKNFKSLSLKREFQKSMQPKSLKFRPDVHRQEWSDFLREHEDCEMQMAKKSDFEEQVLKRLQTQVVRPKCEDIKSDSKVNKSKVDKGKGFKKTEDESEKVKRDENVNHLDVQFNCSEERHPWNYRPKVNEESTVWNINDWKNILPLLTSWRVHLDYGVPFYGLHNTAFQARRLHNVYLSKSEKVKSDTDSKKGLWNQGTVRFKKRTKTFSHSRRRRFKSLNRKSTAVTCPRIVNGQLNETEQKPTRHKEFSTLGRNQNNNMQNEEEITPGSITVSQSSLGELTQSVLEEKRSSASRRDPGDIGSEALHSETASEARLKGWSAQELPPLRLTISSQLKLYNFDCSCPECTSQAAFLDAFKIDPHFEPVNGYPLTLGQLRKDFKFLAYKDCKPSLNLGEEMKCDAFRRLGTKDVADRLLSMINKFVIRKEILSTSLGQTFVTVTFTRPNVILGMTSYLADILASGYLDVVSSADIPASGYLNVVSSADILASGYLDVVSSADIPASGYLNVVSSADIPASGYLDVVSSADILASGYLNVVSSADILASGYLDVVSSADILASGYLDVVSSADILASGYLDVVSSADIPASGYLNVVSSADILASGYLDVVSSADILASGYLDVVSSADIPASGYLNVVSSADILASGYLDVVSSADILASGYLDVVSSADILASGYLDVVSSADIPASGYLNVVSSADILASGYLNVVSSADEV
ncbi:hypothetical protein BgiMline_000926 [Biomphalaria glabrata]